MQRVEVLLNASSRRNASNVVVGVVGVGQDITAMTRGKAELSRMANDLTRLIDTANAPIFGIDANGLVNEWNRKAAEITGYSKEEVIGQHMTKTYITEVSSPKPQQSHTAKLHSQAAKPQPSSQAAAKQPSSSQAAAKLQQSYSQAATAKQQPSSVSDCPLSSPPCRPTAARSRPS